MQSTDRSVNDVNDSVDDASANSADLGDGRKTRWNQHREDRRGQLLAAAIDAIMEYGPDVDMAQIARIAGVTKPVLYRYFSDKAELWRAVGEHVANLIVDAVAPAIERVREDRTLISATIDAYLSAIETNPDLYRYVMRRGKDGMPAVVSTSSRTIATALARVMGDRLRALGLDAGPAEPWAYGMVAMVQAVGDWWMTHDRPMSRSALTEYLTVLLWQGIEGIRESADLPQILSSGTVGQP